MWTDNDTHAVVNDVEVLDSDHSHVAEQLDDHWILHIDHAAVDATVMGDSEQGVISGTRPYVTCIFVLGDDSRWRRAGVRPLVTSGPPSHAAVASWLRESVAPAHLNQQDQYPALTLRIDNAELFSTQAFAELSAALGITLVKHSSFVPEAKGVIERFFASQVVCSLGPDNTPSPSGK